MLLRRAFSLSVLAPLLLASSVARGADCQPTSRVSTCIDADNLWHRPGSAQFLSVAGTSAIPAGQLSFGFLSSYQRRPVVLRLPSSEPGGSDAYAIDDQLNASLLWSFGLGRGVELTAVAPVTLYQNGVGTSLLTSQDSSPIIRSALRDVRLGVNTSIVSRQGGYAGEGLAVSARGELVLPTGDKEVFAGGRGVGFAPSLVADYRVGRVLIGAEVGMRQRQPVEITGITIGPSFYEALGISVDILGERLSVAAEAFALEGIGSQKVLTRSTTGAVSALGDRSPLVPAEWMVSVRSAPVFAGDLSLHLGAGASIPLSDNDVTSPGLRISAGVRYAPTGRDTDGDGILDRDDQCPTEPEDRDGFQDEDGCPDPDNDRDGIPDSRDRCRDAPEDFDGVEDDDGCPDLDDDHDGVPDADDRCRNEAEDRDNFEDDDGCPELDNDRDGIPDAQDMCPNGPEDFDGFRDQDGCPDPDNDGDGIPDAQDQCPNEAEDRDGFEDDDGCPEPDNDHDGILDKADKCPNEPETINGVDDEDGCPEPGARDLVSVQGARVELATPLRFAAGKSALTPDGASAVRMASQKARSVTGFTRLVVETYGDGGGSARQEKLAADRAEAVRAVLLASGLKADQITVAVGDLAAKRPAQASHVDFTVAREVRKPGPAKGEPAGAPAKGAPASPPAPARSEPARPPAASKSGAAPAPAKR